MQRRKLLGASATALTAAVGTGFLSSCTIRRENTKSTTSLPTIRWRMATSWPISLDTIYGGAETISKRVHALSGGNFQIKPYASGEIVRVSRYLMQYKLARLNVAIQLVTTTKGKILLLHLEPQCHLV